MIFLIALRDCLNDDPDAQDYINVNYINNTKIKDKNGEYKIKLKQIATDWKVFCDVALSREISNKNSKIYINYQFFKTKLNNFLQNSDADFVLPDLIEKSLNQFSLITIELELKNSWENPQEIFESMNSIGKLLSLADLVRNYLLMGKSDSEQEYLYNEYWIKMEQILPNKISDFIRDYMQYKACKPFPKASEKNTKTLYYEFKKLFESANNNTEEFLDEFMKFAEYYAVVINYNTVNTSYEVSRYFSDFSVISCSIAHSFFMALVNSWKTNHITEKELCSLLRCLRTYFIRRRLLQLTQAENKVIPTLVKKIPEIEKSANKVKTLFEILSSLENRLRLPNDNESRTNLRNMNFYNFNLNKFIFALIEEQLTNKRPELEEYKIDPIMPPILNDNWKKELGDKWEEVFKNNLNNIGNLTLISSDSKIENKSFDYKKETYQTGSLLINKKLITEQLHWNLSSIDTRRNYLIDQLLCSVIDVPVEMKYANNFKQKNEIDYFSFEDLDLIGEMIAFKDDPSIQAKVISDTTVEFEGKEYKLSPLTKLLKERLHKQNKSNSYRGCEHWTYDGEKLIDYVQ